MEVEYFLNSLSKCLTITLSAQNPSLKTSALLLILKHICTRNKPVHFLDLDLQFSSTLANLPAAYDLKPLAKLVTYCPKENEVFDSMMSLLSQDALGRGGAIVIDSVNSLQDLLRQGGSEADSTKANHKAAIILTLFQELARSNSKFLILSNIVRSRPHLHNGGVAWEKELVGGRVVKLKSDVLLSIAGEEREKRNLLDNIRLEVLSVSENCETDLTQGQIIELPSR